jgi:TPR repeat protein
MQTLNNGLQKHRPCSGSIGMKRSWFTPIVFAAVLVATGCQASPDVCRDAVRHYEAEDLPNGKIVNMFQEMADQGDVRGTMWMARLYLGGRCSLPKNVELAQKMATNAIVGVRQLAEKGDVEAEFLLGAAYQEGLAVKQNPEEAVKWLTKSAADGHLTAMNNLGVMLTMGSGIEPDIKRARQLFSQAAGLGSLKAARNLVTFSNDRDDSERLKALRTVPLVKVLGMKEREGIAFLVTNGLISDPKGYEQSDYKGLAQYHFKKDGVLIQIEVTGRIIEAEAHVGGFHGSEQFRGTFPLGITWNDTAETAQQKLGEPDDSGVVTSDQAYGMAYRTENLSVAVMFSYDGERKLKVFRVFEKWAVKYPDQ